MICIECLASVESLYTVYSNKHIQLTDCPKCQNVVDKYVEIDNVILFIDLLLLKPGAYRHLVYNSLEKTLSQHADSQVIEGSLLQRARSIAHNLNCWRLRFDQLNRIWILLIAFEIYLTWATEERKYSLYREKNGGNNAANTENLIMAKLLSWNALQQYLYFALYCIIDITLFHNITRYCIINWFDWGRDIKYAKDVLSYAILLSYGAKIFPILMLIWPYDTVFSMNVIKWVANLYIIESLKIVTRLPYTTLVEIFLCVSVIRWSLVKPIMILLVAKGDWQQISVICLSEFNLALQKFMIKDNYFLL